MAKSREKQPILKIGGGLFPPQTNTRDGSNSVQSVLNLVKVCIGTGALALPFAVSQGGILFGTFGLFVIAGWNQYASYRLDMLRGWTGAPTYASLAEVVLGPWARMLVDVCTISTLLGVCVVYTITFATLVHATSLSLAPNSPSIWRETILCGALVLPLCCSPHLKFLANTSAVGLLALVAGFAAMFVYGVQEFGYDGLAAVRAAAASAGGGGGVLGDGCGSMSLFPADLSHFSHWFGVAAFCYGVPPLHFSLQDAQSAPPMYTSYLAVALGLVFGLYVVGGAGIAMLYRCDPQGIQENVLSNLPEGSWFATTVRVCYAVVCVTSFPLCLVPVADMAKPLIQQASHSLAGTAEELSDWLCRRVLGCPRHNGNRGGGYGPVVGSSSSGSHSTMYPEGCGGGCSGGGGGGASDDVLSGQCVKDECSCFDLCTACALSSASSSSSLSTDSPSPTSMVPLRMCIVVFTTATALAFPHFGLIVAITGAFSVTTTSFVLPSLMALACAVDSEGVTQAGHKPWMSSPSKSPTKSPSTSSLTSSTSASPNSNNVYGAAYQGEGGGGGVVMSALALPPLSPAASSSPSALPSPSSVSSSFRSNSAAAAASANAAASSSALSSSSFSGAHLPVVSPSFLVVGNTPCRPPDREMNGFGADASPLWWWVDISALSLGIVTCAVATALTLTASSN